MKIIKIIVDKLPDNCRDCGLFHTWYWRERNEDWFVCYASQKNICKAETIFKKPVIERPDWCPLEESD